MMDGLGGGAREAVIPLPLFTVGETYLDLNILDYQVCGEEGYSGASLCSPRWPSARITGVCHYTLLDLSPFLENLDISPHPPKKFCGTLHAKSIGLPLCGVRMPEP